MLRLRISNTKCRCNVLGKWAYFVRCFLSFCAISLILLSFYSIQHQAVLLQRFSENRMRKKSSTVWTRWTPELELYDRSFTEEKRIFFHETSGKGYLNFQQTCCVESAAKHHPTRPVQIFLSADTINNAFPWVKILSAYNNTEIILIDNEQYFKGTEFEDWYKQGLWKTSEFKFAHLADYLRIITAKRGGGLYIDLDIIVRKPFDLETFDNFLVYDNDKHVEIANAIFRLKKDHPVVKEIIAIMAEAYDPEDYILSGPDAFRDGMFTTCKLIPQLPKTNTCKDIRLWPHTLVRPIDTFISDIYFNEVGMEEEWRRKVGKSHAAHFSGAIGHIQFKSNLTANMNRNHLFGLLARTNCPITFSQVSAFELP